MNGLLVRVGADQSEGGGHWNGPVDSLSSEFVYVSIPESGDFRDGLNTPYAGLREKLDAFGARLPAHLVDRQMHLDPDFAHLSYGDQGQKGKQIRETLKSGDLIAFYSGLRDTRRPNGLVYALIGLLVVDGIIDGADVPSNRWHENAHTRRVPSADASDIIVRARQGVSGRLQRCIPIGDYRDRAYRVWPDLQEAWGGLSVRDGYLQRSARPPSFHDAGRFYKWFLSRNVDLVQRNN
ncbi:Nmad3 family putative nucleotide modification protein [Dokdonella immobilis]|uniref:Nucleotide modification associated domain-containing protein n=1 Tax=Dokdonella immobilis TaxID=578942 RepID=A0A1I4ZV99_9GAMM|nr:hypothetical protein [Dokdonella immobilis]SFN54087.1 hypothetical protein SAMN05216289_12929 [Dokdonella immobilis]